MARRYRPEIGPCSKVRLAGGLTDSRHGLQKILAVCAAVFLIAESAAGASLFSGLGFPDVGPDGVVLDFTGSALSADGSTAVGSLYGRISGISTNTPVARFATSWTEASGNIAFAPPPIPGAPGNDFPRIAEAVSADGSIIVGRADGLRFFQYNAGTDTTLFYGPELRLSTISDVSGDGNTIIGRALVQNASFPYRLTGMDEADRVRLENPAGIDGAAAASAIAGDGSIVVGGAGGHAVWWDSSGTGTLVPDTDATSAVDVSSDGSFVVGGGGAGAFWWDTSLASVDVLESLFENPGNDFAIAVSDDGSRVIGFSDGVSVLWDEHDQVTGIRDLLEDIGLGSSISGWDLGSVVDISADGRTIMGNGTNPLGKDESWMAVIETIPERPLDPNVIWSDELNDGLWHSTIGNETNWETNPEDPESDPEIAPPPGSDGIGVIGIFDDDVTLNGTPPGTAVTSIESLFASGSLALNAPLALSGRSSAENVTIDSDVSTQAKFVLDGANHWRSGTISGDAANVGPGGSRIELTSATSSLNIEDGNKSLDTNLLLKGGASATQFGGTLTIGNGASLTIDTGSNYFIENGTIVSSQAIINKGEFAKGSLANEVTIDAPLTSDDGTIAVGKGMLILTNFQTHKGGSYEVSSGATLKFEDAITSVSGALSATGNGDVTLRIGVYGVPNVDDSATFDLGGPLGLHIDGATVSSIGTVTNKNKARFEFGVLEGGQVNTGNTVFEGGFDNAIDGVLRISDGVIPKDVSGLLQNNGTILHEEGTTISIGDAGVIVNRSGGTYRATGDSSILAGANPGRFENAGGTFETVVGATEDEDAVLVGVPLHVSQGGTVKVNQGTQLELAAASNHTGTGTFSVQGTLMLQGDQDFDGDFTIDGAGETVVNKFTISDGEVAVKGNRLRLQDESASISSAGGSLIIDGGTLEENPGSLLWDRGRIRADSPLFNTDALVNRGGTVVIDRPGPELPNPETPRLSNTTFRNTGAGLKTGRVVQRAEFQLENGHVITEVGGVWRTEAESEIRVTVFDTNNSFTVNGGSFIKAGPGTASYFVPFALHNGTVNVEEGKLLLGSGGKNGFFESASPGGEFGVAAGATLEMTERGYEFSGQYAARGEGALLISDGARFDVSGGTFTLDLNGAGNAVFAGDRAGGFSGGLLINKGNAQWHKGTFGQFRNELGATMTIAVGGQGGEPKRLAGGLNENRGIINHALGAVADFNGFSAGTVSNEGVYNLHGQFSFPDPGPSQITFRNQVGGIFRLAETDVLRNYDGAFINLGSVVVEDGSTLRLREVPSNLLNYAGDPSGLLANGRWIANANSKIELGGANAGRIARNEASITLRGNGRITNLPDADAGDFDLNLGNAGSLRLLENTIYRVPGDFVNEGILEVDGTSELIVAGDFESESGSMMTVDSLLHADGDFINNGGITSGRGIVISTGYSNIAGTINPGNSSGSMTIMSDYEHGVAATLEAEIGGLAPGDDHDQLIIDGIATLLGGTLDLKLWEDFAPELGDTFDVLIADLIVGVFGTVEQPLFMGEALFGVSIVDLAGANRQALRVVSLHDYSAVPLPPALLLFCSGLFTMLIARRRATRRWRVSA